MIRAGLVLLVMMAGAPQLARAGCVGDDKSHVVLAREGITLTEDRFPFTFPAIVRQVVGESGGKAASGHMMWLSAGVEITTAAMAPDFIGLPKGAHFDQTMPYADMSIIWDVPPQ
jgi:hypothetical protein